MPDIALAEGLSAEAQDAGARPRVPAVAAAVPVVAAEEEDPAVAGDAAERTDMTKNGQWIQTMNMVYR